LKNVFRSLLLGAVLGLLGAGGAVCAGTAPAGSAHSGAELRVGYSGDYPPLAFTRDGTAAGVEADLAHKVGKALGRKIRFVRLPFAELIPALESDRIDIIMSGMSVTPERQRRVAFTSPYLRIGQMALIRVSDAARLAEPEALYRPGLRVGYKRHTTGETFVRENLAQARPVGFETIDAGIEGLRDRKIDVFIHDAPTIWRVGNDPGERDLIGINRALTKEYLAWAVRKDDKALKRKLDQLVARWITSGSMSKAINRWVLVSVKVQ